jgi:hypothetical protein
MIELTGFPAFEYLIKRVEHLMPMIVTKRINQGLCPTV